MDGIKWQESRIGFPLPSSSIVGGSDSDGSIIYVARSLYAGIKLPAKAIPSKRACYVAFDGLEISVEGFEVLTGDSLCFSWEPSSRGKCAANALSTDTIGDEEIFVGRAPFCNSLTIGRIQASHRCLFIPYDGKEHRLEHYEVLVYRTQPQMGCLIDLGFYRHTPSKVKALRRLGELTENQASQLQAMNSKHTPHTSTKMEWTHTTSRSSLPPTSILGGRDSNFSILFIGRCMHEGHLLPCKVIPNKRVACVTLHGLEIQKQSFEILIGSCSKWEAAREGNIPRNAFPGGYTKQGEVLYIGRANYNGGLIVGRIHKSHGCIYIGANGREHSLAAYEVLIED